MIVLLGKSGVGKSEIAKSIASKGYKMIVSFTTRPMREGEVDGLDYHFITEDEFFYSRVNGVFAEWAAYNTIHGKWYYGSSILDYTRKSVITLTPDGLRQVLACTKNNDRFSIFPVLLTANADVVNERLHKRGDDPDEIARRMSADDTDFIGIDKLNPYVVVNNGEKSPYQIANQIISVYEDWLCNDDADIKYEEIVYVSHPYGGDPKNVVDAERIVRELVKKNPKNLYISPLNAFGYLYDDTSYEDGLNMCLFLLSKCTKMYLCDGYENSTGCNAEIEYCEKHGIPYESVNNYL